MLFREKQDGSTDQKLKITPQQAYQATLECSSESEKVKKHLQAKM